jgi:hypothetical protein
MSAPILSGRTRQLRCIQRKGGHKTRAKLSGKLVVIWSGEHGLWWRANASGYTSKSAFAGVYRFEDAWSHTHHCGPEKRISFEVVLGVSM